MQRAAPARVQHAAWDRGAEPSPAPRSCRTQASAVRSLAAVHGTMHGTRHSCHVHGCTAQCRSTLQGCGHGGGWCSPRLSVQSPWRACHVWNQRTNTSVALLRARYLVQCQLPSPLETPCHHWHGIALGQSVAKEITGLSGYPSLLVPILSIALVISLARPSVVPPSRVSCSRLDVKPKRFSAVVDTD